MSIPNQELLRKATLTTADFGGPGEAPLTVEAADSFIELMTIGQHMLSDVQVVKHNAAKWQQSTIQFASRILKPGVQGTRLLDADRSKPTTGIIEMSTVLIRGEVPIVDEVFEDNIQGDAFAATLERMIADRAGFDLEELALAGDTASGDPYLALLDGWLKQMRTGGTAHVVNAASLGTDYQTIFRQLMLSLPEQAMRNVDDLRYYVPRRLEQMYRDQLSARGTPMGDIMLSGNNEVTYQGITIKPVPTIPITAGTPDTAQIFLTNKNNLYAGFRRQLNIESFRDPREGATSFVISCRFDAKVANVDFTATATNVNVEPA